MKWYEKFKVGQNVRVVKKVMNWHFDKYTGGSRGRGADWVYGMDKTIGKVYRIVRIDADVGYRLETDKVPPSKYNYWYPVESLQGLVGE